MGKTTGIQWCDHTFNPWWGCTKISPGCDHCYAEIWATAKKGHKNALWQGQLEFKVSVWKEPLKWDREAARAGRHARVFSGSMCDVFDNQAPLLWRHRLWQLIQQTPRLDWLLLTKRPQNIAKMLPGDWANGWPNVWLGVSVENRVEADRRIPVLQRIPARIRFLSCEPLLEAVEPDLAGIDWVICGGESQKGWRPMDLEWARALRDQCNAADVAFFMKQVAAYEPQDEMIPPDLLVREHPETDGRQVPSCPQQQLALL